MPLTTKKSVIVGHGIDVSLFKPSDQDPEPNRIVSVGRLTKAKRIELLLGLLRVLPETQLTLVGVPITGEDKKYVDSLKIAIHNENLEDRVTMGPLSQEELVHVLQRSSVFVHVSETALDKALLEAMACGIPVVSTSKAAPGTVPEECLATDVTLGDTIHSMLELSDSEREKLGKKLRSVIEEEHSLGSLIERLLNLMA
jgi:glycosyltransferase involved in cell wall biosynthesis